MLLAGRKVPKATVRLARACGAVPLIGAPQFEPEEQQERDQRRRIVEEGNVRYVDVPRDADERIENDGHPARTAREQSPN